MTTPYCDKDTRSLAVIEEWIDREYNSEAEKLAALQVIINGALVEQNRLTRSACVSIILPIVGRSHRNFFITEIRDACESVEAI